MENSMSTPRILAEHLDSFVGRAVIIVGKVLQLRGNYAVIDAEGQITILLTPNCHLTTDNAAHVIGKVEPGPTVKVLAARDLGRDVDYQICHAVVGITHRHKDIFITEP